MILIKFEAKRPKTRFHEKTELELNNRPIFAQNAPKMYKNVVAQTIALRLIHLMPKLVQVFNFEAKWPKKGFLKELFNHQICINNVESF